MEITGGNGIYVKLNDHYFEYYELTSTAEKDIY